MPQTVISDLRPRLAAARLAVADAQRALATERQRRDQLIVAAIDEGMAQRAVAAAAGVSNTRVVAILADSEPDAVLPRG